MKYSLFAFAVLLIVACGDSEQPQMSEPSFADVDVVTGLQLTDAAGQLVGLWRQPNQKPGSLLLFPNPAGDVVSLAKPSGSNAPADMSQIWIVQADCLRDDETTDITLQSLSLSYEQQVVDPLSVLKITPQSIDSGIIQLDLSSLSSGFYKVFVADSAGSLFWINLYKSSNIGSQVLQFAELDGACQ